MSKHTITQQHTTTQMAQEVTTLAEVFLKFGGQTMYTLGTAWTAMGVIFGVHRLTGLGINIFSNLPSWLGMKQNNGPQLEEKPSDVIFTKQQLWQEVSAYAKISLLIFLGVTIKFLGNILSLDSTTQALNAMLYKQ